MFIIYVRSILVLDSMCCSCSQSRCATAVVSIKLISTFSCRCTPWSLARVRTCTMYSTACLVSTLVSTYSWLVHTLHSVPSSYTLCQPVLIVSTVQLA